MAKIPVKIKRRAKEIISNFNEENKTKYGAQFRGQYLYLNYDHEPMCRLRYNGKMDNWDFAIFRWSTEEYDRHDNFFPGAEEVDGTIEGAMKATLKAYPQRGGCLKNSPSCLLFLLLIPFLIVSIFQAWIYKIQKFFSKKRGL
jgi:hypothetical protein